MGDRRRRYEFIINHNIIWACFNIDLNSCASNKTEPLIKGMNVGVSKFVCVLSAKVGNKWVGNYLHSLSVHVINLRVINPISKEYQEAIQWERNNLNRENRNRMGYII